MDCVAGRRCLQGAWQRCRARKRITHLFLRTNQARPGYRRWKPRTRLTGRLFSPLRHPWIAWLDVAVSKERGNDAGRERELPIFSCGPIKRVLDIGAGSHELVLPGAFSHLYAIHGLRGWTSLSPRSVATMPGAKENYPSFLADQSSASWISALEATNSSYRAPFLTFTPSMDCVAGRRCLQGAWQRCRARKR